MTPSEAPNYIVSLTSQQVAVIVAPQVLFLISFIIYVHKRLAVLTTKQNQTDETIVRVEKEFKRENIKLELRQEEIIKKIHNVDIGIHDKISSMDKDINDKVSKMDRGINDKISTMDKGLNDKLFQMSKEITEAATIIKTRNEDKK